LHVSGLLTRRERAGSAGQGDAAVYRPAAWVRVQGTAPSPRRPTYKTLAEQRGRLTEAEELVHGLDRRFAFNILALRWVGNWTWRIIAAFGFIGAATSPFMSNGSTGARSSCSAPASPWAR
jgi:hypothetical protein